MSNAVEDFLAALQRTINGDPYPVQSPKRYAPISYRIADIRDPLAGSVLSSRYRIEGRIGKGAMSSVYKAVQEPIGRVVALKVLNREFSQDPVSVKRFQREAKTVSGLRHPNIMSIQDVGYTETDQPFFVMEFLDGMSLERVIEKRGAVVLPRALPIFCQICDGMAYAHGRGLIHRDLKPANIMLVKEEGSGNEVAKLVDFGIVKQTSLQSMTQRLTKKGEIWGSPVYMSPEQCMGNELDGRADVYSLGLLMYETLLGVPAFKGGAAIGTIISRQLTQMPAPFSMAAPSLKIPDELEKIVFKAIQKKPEDRFSSMDDLREALESFARNSGIKVPKSTVRSAMSESSGTPTVPYERERFEVFKASSVQQAPDLSQIKSPGNIQTDRSPEGDSRIGNADDSTVRSSVAEHMNNYSRTQVPGQKKEINAPPVKTDQKKTLITVVVIAIVLVIVASALAIIAITVKPGMDNSSKQQSSDAAGNKKNSTTAQDETAGTVAGIRSHSGSPDPKQMNASSVQSAEQGSTQDSTAPTQILSTKNKFGSRKKHIGNASPSQADDEALLERVHLKKHKKDMTQQWLNIQQKEEQ